MKIYLNRLIASLLCMLGLSVSIATYLIRETFLDMLYIILFNIIGMFLIYSGLEKRLTKEDLKDE